MFENEDITDNIDTIIIKSLNIKKNVVEQDEKETGLRKILNFGHTIGHGIESEENNSGLFHGECVALGMLMMCSPQVRERVIKVLKKAGLPTQINYNKEAVCKAMLHDKKFSGGEITVIKVDTVGEFFMEKMSGDELSELIKNF